MAIGFGNIGLSLTNGLVGGAVSMGNNWLKKQISIGFKERGAVKFYAKYEAGGSVVNVLAKKLAHNAAGMLKEAAMQQLKEWADKLLGKKIDDKAEENAMAKLIEKAQKNDDAKYGVMKVDGGAVVAMDIYGHKCIDAIMLGIPVKEAVSYTVEVGKKTHSKNLVSATSFSSNTLVWYDPTALVNVDSDRNLIITPVQGRDYSRKELVSNGDVSFTVSGHIMSNMPEVYPATDVQKFIQIMQYKGVVRVNNIVIDQFNVDNVVIKSFSLSPKEGYKSQQDYTFNCVGTMPTMEVKVTEDTINIIDNSLKKVAKEKSPWQQMLDARLEGMATNVLGAADQGLSMASGMLDNIF